MLRILLPPLLQPNEQRKQCRQQKIEQVFGNLTYYLLEHDSNIGKKAEMGEGVFLIQDVGEWVLEGWELLRSVWPSKKKVLAICAIASQRSLEFVPERVYFDIYCVNYTR